MKKVKIVFLSFLILSLMFFSKSNIALAVERTRVYGENRYKTSLELLKSNFTKSDYIILCSGENFADSIAASPLASNFNAPILLTPKEGLDSDTLKIVKNLKVKRAYIIGGKNVISTDLDIALRKLGIPSKRLSGLDRYETSSCIANEINPSREIVITAGDNFSNGLSIAPIASIKNMPIFLTSKTSLSEEIKSYINKNNVSNIYVIGDETSIPSNILNDLSDYVRISGSNIYDTNLSVINYFRNIINLNKVFLCTGEEFADALSASPICAKSFSPIVLVNENLQESTTNFFNKNSFSINLLTIIGGYNSISSALSNNIEKQLTSIPVLNTREDFINSIVDALKSARNSISFRTSQNFSNLFRDVLNDVYLQYGDYTDYVQFWNLKYQGDVYILDITRTMNNEEVAKRLSESDKMALDIINKFVPSSLDPESKERIIHDYIINHSTYNYKAIKKQTLKEDDSTTYGILIKGIGISDGYAKATQKLLRMCGIKNYIVKGSIVPIGQPHCWNIVEINNKCYHLDTCLDDPIPKDGKTQTLIRKYFNISEREIQNDHYWEKSNYVSCE